MSKNSMDMPAHRRTYSGFLKLCTYGTISVIATLVLMAIVLL